jgi:hypothetical protein
MNRIAPITAMMQKKAPKRVILVKPEGALTAILPVAHDFFFRREQDSSQEAKPSTPPKSEKAATTKTRNHVSDIIVRSPLACSKLAPV